MKRALKDAWSASDANLARRQLEPPGQFVSGQAPWRSRQPSLRESLEETVTVQDLGITGALYRTLRTTNPRAQPAQRRTQAMSIGQLLSQPADPTPT